MTYQKTLSNNVLPFAYLFQDRVTQWCKEKCLIFEIDLGQGQYQQLIALANSMNFLHVVGVKLSTMLKKFV